MAYQYAGHYVEALLKNTNASARLLAGIPVVIRLTDGVTLATVYEGRSKAATISNPVITDASGNLSAWLDPGSYLGFPVIEGVEQAAFPMFVGIDPVEADTPPASEVVVTPAGGITATNVQAALVELDTEKATVAALDAEAAARAAADALLVPLTQKGAADGVATLGGDGKLTAGQLPDLAISAFLGTTASEAAMLALVGQRGDWTVRTDTDPDTTWMLTADDPTLLANWRQLSTVTDAVASVNGRTGAVVGLAEAADLTAEANARALADAAEATARTVADGLKAPLASPTFTGVPSMPVVEVTGKNGLSTRRFSGRKTTTGAPTTGTWAVDDEVLDSNGTLWRCTVAGTPGTWVQSSGTIVTAPAASGDVTGVTDRNAIQAALDALGVIGTGTLYVSAGTYIFAKSAAGAWCIDVPAGVRIMWHPSAWWKLADNQPNSTSVVRIAADNVTLDHPGIDGNVDNNAVTTNQKHGIVVNGAAHTRILFPRLKNTEGDGIYLGTSSVVTDTQIFKPWCSNNKRNGITLGSTDGWWVESGYFDSNIVASAIDAEPANSSLTSLNGWVRDNLILANNNNAIAVTGKASSGLCERIKIVDNILLGGSIALSRCNDVDVKGNTIVGANTAGLWAIQVGYASTSIRIQDNDITAPVERAIYVFAASGETPSRIRIRGNRINCAASVDGVYVSTANDVRVEENLITGAGGAGTHYGVYVQAAAADLSNIRINRNVVKNMSSHGIFLTRSASLTITRVQIIDNTLDDDQGSPTMTTGIATGAAVFITDLEMRGNQYGTNVTTKESIAPITRPSGRPQTTSVFAPSSAVAWSAQPAAVTELFGSTRSRWKLDLSQFAEARLTVRTVVTGVAGSVLRAQYSSDQSSWNYLDGTSGPEVAIDAANATQVGSWAALATAAKADMFLRIVGVNGDGVASPSLGLIVLELR